MKVNVNSMLVCLLAMGIRHCTAEPITLYVDAGMMFCCQRAEQIDTLARLFLLDLSSHEIRSRPITRDYPFWHPSDVSAAYVDRFPRAWTVANGRLTVLYPDFFSSATGNMCFRKMTIWNLKAFCGNDPAWNMRTKSSDDEGPGALGFMSSIPFPCIKGKDASELATPWYAIGEKGVVVRLPWARKAKHWSPRDPVVRNDWREVSWKLSLQSRECAGGLTGFDGYNPIAGVYVLAKTVLMDGGDFAAPEQAEWLIWERKGDECRLCQMRDGRWSVCENASRKDIPKIIVVNNDENSVFLSFSQEFDMGDVSNSLMRTVAYLKARGALHLDRPRLLDRNQTDVTLPVAKNLDAVERNEEPTNDAKSEGPKKQDVADLKCLPPEDRAKKGAELYERTESREQGLALLKESAKEGSPFALVIAVLLISLQKCIHGRQSAV